MAKINEIDIIKVDVSSILQKVRYETEEKVVEPSTEKQVILPSVEKYIDKVIVNPVESSIDKDITADNIKLGVNILGVTGTYTADANATTEDLLKNKTAYVNGEKIVGTFVPLDTSDATATADSILKNETAYVNGEKIVGNMPNIGELNYTPTTSVQVIPKGYTSGGSIERVTSNIDPNIKAENIKKGVSILDVDGSCEDSILFYRNKEDFPAAAEYEDYYIELDTNFLESEYPERPNSNPYYAYCVDTDGRHFLITHNSTVSADLYLMNGDASTNNTVCRNSSGSNQIILAYILQDGAWVYVSGSNQFKYGGKNMGQLGLKAVYANFKMYASTGWTVPEGTEVITNEAAKGVIEYYKSNGSEWVKVGYDPNGEPNLLPENIKSGVTIFGVTGTYTG